MCDYLEVSLNEEFPRLAVGINVRDFCIGFIEFGRLTMNLDYAIFRAGPQSECIGARDLSSGMHVWIRCSCMGMCCD